MLGLPWESKGRRKSHCWTKIRVVSSADYTEGVKGKRAKRAMEQAYVRERVTPLLKQDARYIYDVPHQVSCKETVMLMVSANINHKKIIDKNDVPFSHPAIEDAIISLYFSS